MSDSERELSRIEQNRMAVTIAVGSLAAMLAFGVVYWYGLLDDLLPPGLPATDELPFLLLLPVLLLALVIWGWARTLSLFE